MKNFSIFLAARRSPAALAKLLRSLPLAAGAALLVVAVPLLACSPTGLNGLRSQVRIEVGKQFELGGTQLLGFRVEAHNVGPVAVEIKERTTNGRVMSLGVLQSGQQTKAAFGMGSKAIVVNLGQREAKVDVNISNGAGLSMGYAAAQPSSPAAVAPRVSGPDLSMANANDWKGTLTYLDYGTQQTVTLNTALRGQMNRADCLILKFDYQEPNKTHVFGTDTLIVAPNGTHLRWDGTDFTVQAKQWFPDHLLRLVLEGPGQDNNHPVTIRKTVLLGTRQFAMRKQVRLEGDTAFVQRNAYKFTR